METFKQIVEAIENADLTAVGPVDLGNGRGVIINPVEFAAAHIATLRRNTGNKTYLPYFERLLVFYNTVIKK